jgi:ATP-dependent Lon protease
MTILPVGTVDEVLSNALTGPMTPIEWEPGETAASKVRVETVDADVGVVTH